MLVNQGKLPLGNSLPRPQHILITISFTWEPYISILVKVRITKMNHLLENFYYYLSSCTTFWTIFFVQYR